MKLSFKNLMGSIASTCGSESEVTVVGVSINKEERDKLSIADKLKLPNSAREGGADKFRFFQSHGKMFKKLNGIQSTYAYRNVF